MANLEQTMVDQAATAGGDWAGLGAVSGPQLLAMLQAGQLRAAFMDNAIFVEVTRAGGQEVGVYRVAEAGEAARFLPPS